MDLETIHIEKLVHGGQGLGSLESGKRAFVWNALPGETVQARILRKKSGYVDAIAEEITVASLDRVDPIEPEAYMSTSPWQILSPSAEALAKQAILEELFTHEKVDVSWEPFVQDEQRYGYRNKMEYNFWWDNETGKVSLALHVRGSHMKLPLEGSALASDAINKVGKRLVEFINSSQLQARSLKSAVLRSTADEKTAVVLYVVDKNVAELDWSQVKADSMTVYYSNPKSPASVPTEVLLRLGLEYLADTIGGREYRYSPEGFFQINLPVYDQAIATIGEWVDAGSSVVDMYAGVGSIGMSLPYASLTSVELDPASSAQAKLNAGENTQVVLSESEKALSYITTDAVIILDPPRAGLHKKVVERLLEVAPPTIIYLSCNPATQARDTAQLLLERHYKVVHARGYNFFPATPHIESLLVLSRV